MKAESFKAGDRIKAKVSGAAGTVVKRHKWRNNGYAVQWDNGGYSRAISPLELEVLKNDRS